MSNNGINTLADDTTTEWYTPPWIIARVRRLYGGQIDLDPASCGIANQIVNATKFYTETDNGLDREWYGNVWVNHPYGRTTNQYWADAICENYYAKQITGICYASTSEKWCSQIIQHCNAFCLLSPRVSFYDPRTDEYRNGSQKGSLIYYFGPNVSSFTELFSGELATVGKKTYRGVASVVPSLEETGEPIDWGFEQLSLVEAA